MKPLNQYIKEKLVINKNFKEANLFASEPLHDSGYCIYLALPKKSNNYDVISIPTELCEYGTVSYDGKPSLYYETMSRNIKIEKNNYGFYFLDAQNSGWCWLILFEKEALSFLENLLQNIKQKIDITNCKDEKFNIKNGSYICADINKKYYDKEKIIDMINELKKKI